MQLIDQIVRMKRVHFKSELIVMYGRAQSPFFPALRFFMESQFVEREFVERGFVESFWWKDSFSGTRIDSFRNFILKQVLNYFTN